MRAMRTAMSITQQITVNTILMMVKANGCLSLLAFFPFDFDANVNI